MAIKIGSNFTFQGQQPNFERDRFATKTAMKAFPETSIDDGHLSYCAEDGNTYQFKSSNSVDATTGKWRVFKTSVDVPIMKGATETADGVVGLVPAPKISERFAWLQASGTWKRLDVSDVPTLTNRVLIEGNQSGNMGGNPGIFKIATITIPKLSNITGTLEFDIQSRHDNFNIMVNINYNTYFSLFVIVNDNSLISNKTPFYYYVDKTKDIDNVILYYDTIQYDSVNVKVTSKTGTLNLSYTIDNIKVDALPEGAIQVHNVNYGNKNLVYATPKDAAGDPTFRAIDITDIPDLSSKYATKEKAFTKDTASTEPGQFVAGPATTQGNLHLRKIDIADIPDLKSKYQPKYAADYIATSDISTLPITNGIIDLNGYRITLPNIKSTDGDLTIRNGIVAFGTNVTSLEIFSITFDNVTIISSDTSTVILKIQELKCFYVVNSTGNAIDFLQEGSAIYQATLINSYLVTSLPITDVLTAYNSVCYINGNIALTAYNSYIGDDGLSLADSSAWDNSIVDVVPYSSGRVANEKIQCTMGFDDTITGDSNYAPKTKVVHEALQLKADKTQLADLATQTDFVDLRNKVNAMPKTVFITQAAYNALTTKDANTIYYING